MLNLMDYLTPTDNKRIENYVHRFGVEDNYIGNEVYLENWNKSKKKLFRLLGGKLVVKIPFKYEKPAAQLEVEMTSLRKKFNSFISEYQVAIDTIRQKEDMDYTAYCRFYDIISYYSLSKNELPLGIKYQSKDNDKTIQLQKGMKPIRALQKVINYFDMSNSIKEGFEKFRIAQSLIYNEKIVSGNLCLSIDPIDFMTMSDNDNSWTSCMSWREFGCYHIGTVEMMNSNNVICAYIESKKSFAFDEAGVSEDPEWNAPNKKWRQLFYVTKDIIVGGKSYPYANETITKLALEELRKLAKENWNVKYSFGPELYKDMTHIGSTYRFDRNREWVRNNTSIKHNILFDSKGMYNDMFNDHNTHYWCIRNKVDREKIISYSGKAKCLCCNHDILFDSDDFYYYDEGSYNDRFENHGHLLCYNCLDERRCDFCGNEYGYNKIHYINGNNVCSHCLKKEARSCPDCGKVFMPAREADEAAYIRVKDDIIYNVDIRASYNRDRNGYNSLISFADNSKALTAFLCEDCLENNTMFEKKDVPKHPADYSWNRGYNNIPMSKKVYDKEDPSIKKYLFNFLKKVDEEQLIDFN